jgi:hypothetical protein
MKNKRFFYKTKKNFNFSIKLQVSRTPLKKLINKIIKSKRLTGLFKRKLNMRTTILKRRSFLFFFLEQKLKKKRFFRKNRKRLYFFKKQTNYRMSNINLHNHVKSIFFENRKILKLYFKSKNLKRQNKMSKYSINFLNRDSKTLLNIFEFNLSRVLIKTHFANNLNDSLFFIKNGYIIVNGKVQTNHNLILNAGDLVRFNAKHNYYFFYRKNLTKSLKMSKKINWAFFKFIKKNKKNKFFPKVYKWIDSSINFGFDIPIHIEVDFINMSFCILLKFFDVNRISYHSIKYINFYLTRLYNWSYIV